MEGDQKREEAQVDNMIFNTKVKKRVFRRKRQGVTKTNSAAVKAIIRRNQTNSPLLTLAPEVREKILTYLVGGQVLHLEKRNVDVPGSRNTKIGHAEKKRLARASIYYYICQTDVSLAQAYDQARNGHASGESVTYSSEDDVKNPRDYHQDCDSVDGVKQETQNLHLSLNILGVSRQLYEEANNLLWSTNTFTFSNGEVFELFFSSLNPAQKRNLTKLCLFAKMHTSYTVLLYEKYQNLEWEKALRPAHLNMLQGLQTLTLCFTTIGKQEYQGHHSLAGLKSMIWSHMDAFVPFRMLPLKQVFVTVGENKDRLTDPRDLSQSEIDLKKIWTTVQMKEFAREWEAKLLDADPKATDKVEREVKESYLRKRKYVASGGV